MTYPGADLTECISRVRALFAPILAEKERLEVCLAKANANHEEFERRYYLESDRVEATEARALAAEAERDKALALVAEGAYADAHKNEPSIYQHALALTVERLKAAEAALAVGRVDADRYRHLRANFVQEHHMGRLMWYLPTRSPLTAGALDESIDRNIAAAIRAGG